MRAVVLAAALVGTDFRGVDGVSDSPPPPPLFPLLPSSSHPSAPTLHGRVAGASGGIGAEAARVFALGGASVWFAARNAAKTAGVVEAVAAELGGGSEARGRLHTLHCDLTSLASVRAAAAEFLATGQPLHILLNNAGRYT